MADWDGTGLPPVAAERVARCAEGGPRASLVSVSGAAGLDSVGLEPVGEVLGCIVQSIGFFGWQDCGYVGGADTLASSNAGRFSGYRPYVDALYRGYDTATARMAAEAKALRADGVVDVRIRTTQLGSNNREFTALGTAVRARCRTRPGTVFVTDLAGQDVAKLMRAGWVPVHIARGISVAIRHDDSTTQAQAGWRAGNVEVSGHTELVTHVRAVARQRFGERIRRDGADGAVVSDMSVDVWEIGADNHRDHVAASVVYGTSLARFHTGPVAPTSSLLILPLH